MSAPLLITDFKPRLGELFTIRLDGFPPFELELSAVRPLGEPFRQGGRHPFSLEFLGPVDDRYLLQHVYPMEHRDLGSLDVFIVPLGFVAGRMRYEAVFT